MSRTGGAAAALAIGLVLGAAPALGGGPPTPTVGSEDDGRSRGLAYRSVTEVVTVVPDEPNLFTKCPGRRVLTGGGAYADGDPELTDISDMGPAWPFIVKSQEVPSARERNTWVTVYAVYGDPQTVSNQAICARPKGIRRSEVTAAEPTAGIGEVVTLRARCPRGSSVTGGGFDSEGNNADALFVSAPFDGSDRGAKPDDGWRLRLLSGQAGRLATVRAICSTRLDLVYRRETVHGDGELTALARCPENTAVAGGGTEILADPLGNAVTHVKATRPRDLGDPGTTPDDGWESRAFRAPGDGQVGVRSHAICKR
jgi:hypothetical protein